MSGNILILGKNGQVGRALIALLGEHALAPDRADIDLLDPAFIPKLDAWLNGRPIAAVINAAAYTAVDKAEGEGKADAFHINGTAVGELAAWCKSHDLPLVHYSTDYVFDGKGGAPHREDETPLPINAYGASKLAGEVALQESGCRYLLFRTSWVYDSRGKNFFTTILRLMKERESLNVVDDQIGAPTYAPHLAEATVRALSFLLPPPVGGKVGEGVSPVEFTPSRFAAPGTFPPTGGGGTYHLCHSGHTSWHGFAQKILALVKPRDPSIICEHITPIPSSAYPLPAPRPHNSRLDCSKAQKQFGIVLPHWKIGLKACMEALYADSFDSPRRSQSHPTGSIQG